MNVIEPALYWLIIGILLFFLELALPGFILFFFALGAIITAIAAWLVPLSIAWQLALFIVASLASLFLLRGLIQKRTGWGGGAAEDDEDRGPKISAGTQGQVATAIIPPAEGQIKCAGTFWRAMADESIEEGAIVAVIRQEDLLLYVKRI